MDWTAARRRAGALLSRARRAVRSVEPHHAEPADEAGMTRDAIDNQRMAFLLAWTLAETDNCIDVGCHEGGFLADVLRLAPEGTHFAFEPIPHLHTSLVDRFPEVTVLRLALSDAAGNTSFVHVRDLPGYSGLRRRTYPGRQTIEEIEVTTARLDDVLPPGYAPALIKIDVEGAEELVLRGARETLRKHRPTVLFEHGLGAADHYGTTPEVVHGLLSDAGLRIFDLDGNGPYSLEAFSATFYANERWNFVAHR